MSTPQVYQVEPLSFGYHVRWAGPYASEVAVVIVEDEDARLFRCCRCRASSCDHAKAVLQHVVERENP